jgi:hypothetical protein
MKISDFVKWAKQAQSVLKQHGVPAKLIYLLGYSDPGVIPSLIFVSDKYNDMDLYQRSQISTSIQKAPLKYNFYILGDKHLARQNSPVSREHIIQLYQTIWQNPLSDRRRRVCFQRRYHFSTKDTVTNKLCPDIVPNYEKRFYRTSFNNDP